MNAIDPSVAQGIADLVGLDIDTVTASFTWTNVKPSYLLPLNYGYTVPGEIFRTPPFQANVTVHPLDLRGNKIVLQYNQTPRPIPSRRTHGALLP